MDKIVIKWEAALKALKNNNGMSIVEVIIAMTIFGLVSFYLLALFTMSLTVTMRMGEREAIIVEASGVLDDYKTSEFIPPINSGFDNTRVIDENEPGFTFTIKFDGGTGRTITPNEFELEFYEIETKTPDDDQSVKLSGFRIRTWKWD